MYTIDLYIYTRILKDVFCGLVMIASSVQLKQLRNDLLMICLRIVQICPDAPFVVRIYNILPFLTTFFDNLKLFFFTSPRKLDFSKISVCLPTFQKVKIVMIGECVINDISV